MSNLAQAAVNYPVSGSWDLVYLRTVQTTTSATLWQAFKRSGLETSGILAVPSNQSRTGLHVFNSGSQALLVGLGHNTTATVFSEKILAYSAATFDGPTYTGNLYVQWDASGTLSGSVCNFTELSS